MNPEPRTELERLKVLLWTELNPEQRDKRREEKRMWFMNPEPRAELMIGTDERFLLRIRIRSLSLVAVLVATLHSRYSRQMFKWFQKNRHLFPGLKGADEYNA